MVRSENRLFERAHSTRIIFTPQDLELAGLAEDPDFWNMDSEDEKVVIRDLTKNQSLFNLFLLSSA